MSDHFATLRSLLYGPPDGRSWKDIFQIESAFVWSGGLHPESKLISDTWESILALFLNWDSAVVCETAIAYAEQHLICWSDAHRTMPSLAPSHPGWPLVRSCVLQDLSLGDVLGLSAPGHAPILSNIKHLSVQYLRDSSKLYHLRLFPSLESLSLIDLHGMSHLNELQVLPKLKKLAFLVRKTRRYHRGILDNISALNAMPQLEKLILTGCSDRCDLSPISNCVSLEQLWLASGQRLTDLEFVSPLPKLAHLRLDECYNLQTVDGVQNIPALETLRLHDSVALQNVDELSECLSLRALTIDSCPELDTFRGLDGHPRLETLHLQRNEKLTSLEGLISLPSLRSFLLSHFSSLLALEPLSHAPQLYRLSIASCPSLQGFDPIRKSERLKHLSIHDCGAIELDALDGDFRLESFSFSPISSAAMHREEPLDSAHQDLVVSVATGQHSTPRDWNWLENATKMASFSSLEELASLKIEDEFELSCLQGVATLQQLRNVDISCRLVHSLDGFQKHCHLESLKVDSYDGSELDGLRNCHALRHLHLGHCPSLLTLDGLSECLEFESLELGDCGRLASIQALSSLPQLQKLSLSGVAWSLDVQDSLSQLEQLEVLHFTNCPKLNQLDWLSSLQNLKRVQLYDCGDLTSAFGLISLPFLEWVSILECRALYPQPERGTLERKEQVKDFQETLSMYQKKRGTFFGQLEKRLSRWFHI